MCGGAPKCAPGMVLPRHRSGVQAVDDVWSRMWILRSAPLSRSGPVAGEVAAIALPVAPVMTNVAGVVTKIPLVMLYVAAIGAKIPPVRSQVSPIRADLPRPGSTPDVAAEFPAVAPEITVVGGTVRLITMQFPSVPPAVAAVVSQVPTIPMKVMCVPGHLG
jgi:hypothetical protein